MADKPKKSGNRHDDNENYNDQYNDNEEFERGNNNSGGNGSKYEKLYGVIDAFIDQIDMPRNRTRAIKYGIRALGELLSETSYGQQNGGRSRHSSSGSHSGERGVSRQRRG